MIYSVSSLRRWLLFHVKSSLHLVYNFCLFRYWHSCITPQGIGEGAIVLGQLLGYDDEAERMAVLDAGLAVRGLEFAHELVALTGEALEGFKAVVASDGSEAVDPELVKSVEAMDERIRAFIEKNEAFQ